MAYYIYLLHCTNNTFYTGITNNLRRRLFEHRNGLSQFTKGRLPVNLVYYETANSRSEARKREIVIKDMSQKKKQELIKKFTSSVSEKRV
jgi:putative endonuclease